MAKTEKGRRDTRGHLKRILDQRNASKRRSQAEITQEKPRNEENNLELRVVSPAEHNSNDLLPEINETVVVLPLVREDNPTREREDNPIMEVEDNSSVQQEKEAESSQQCDAVFSPISRGEKEETVSARSSQIIALQLSWAILLLVVSLISFSPTTQPQGR